MLPIVFTGLIDENNIPGFEALYKKTKCIMYKKAYSILNNQQLAEDCVADVYLAVARLYSKIGKMSLKEQQRCLYIAVKNNAYRSAPSVREMTWADRQLRRSRIKRII